MSSGSDRRGRFEGGGGSNDRERSDGQLQPVDPRDLRRHPPASDACVAVRARLRDFLDGELPPRQAAHLEHHVHECRSCALALSRAELEVLRLRKAFEEERRQLEQLPPGLTASILDAVEPEFFAAFGRSAVGGEFGDGDFGDGEFGDGEFGDDFDDGLESDVELEGAGDDESFAASDGAAAADSSTGAPARDPRGAGRGRRSRRARGVAGDRDADGRGALDGWAVLDGEFTGRVMARVRREWQPTGPWSRLVRRMAEHRTATFAAAGVLVVLLAALAWLTLHGGAAGATVQDGLLVAQARDARRSATTGSLDGAEPAASGGAPNGPSAALPEGSGTLALSGSSTLAGARPGWPELAAGDPIPAGAAFAVGSAGHLTLVDGRRYGARSDVGGGDGVWGDPARPIEVDRGEPLRVQFHGAGLGRFFDEPSLAAAGLPWSDVGAADLPEGPVLDLDHGTLDLFLGASRGRALPVSLGGFAWLVAEPDSEISVSLLGVLRADPAVGAEASVAGRVEVVRGRAELWLGVRREPITAGTVARFDPLGALTFEQTPDSLLDGAPAAGVAQGQVTSPVPLDDPAAWRGRVVRAGSLTPVVGARIRIAVGSGDHQIQTRLTGADGRFAFVLDDPGAPLAVLSIVPDAVDGDLGIEPALRVALDSFAGRERQLDTIELQVGREVVGAVRDAGVPVDDAEVRAMVIDQVFGLVDGLSEVRTRTDAAGEFRLVGLPPALEPHQSLVVFVPQQDGKVPAAVAQVAWRSQPGELAIERSRRVDVDLPATRDVTLVDVPDDRSFTILQAIPGVPLTAMAVTLPVQRAVDGEVLLRDIGPGALFAVDRSGRRVIDLVALGAPADPNRLGFGGDAGVDFFNRIERLRMATAEGIGEDRHVALWSSRGSRMRSPYAPGAAPGGVTRERRYLTVAHSSKLVAQAANLYIEFGDGRIEFLGVYDGGPSLGFDLPTVRPFWLIAIGRDNGAVGVVEIAEGTTDLPAVVEVASPGEVDLSAVLGAAHRGMCAFRLLDGPLAGRTFWRSLDGGDQGIVGDLPPGRYRVELANGTLLDCEVQAGARVAAKPAPEAQVEDGDASKRE